MDSFNEKDFWDTWYSSIYGYFLRRVNLKQDAEDLVASTLAALLTNPAITTNSLKIEHTHAYIWKVAHNHLVKYIKTKTTTPTLVSVEDIENSVIWQPPTNELEYAITFDSQYQQRMKDLLNCTNNYLEDPVDKSLILLSLIEDKNSTEISQITGLKSDTIRQKLRRLVNRIRINCRQLWPESNKNNS
jgi:RNA polymerase sigma factor (sigma-70 family)